MITLVNPIAWCGKMPSFYRRQFELYVSDENNPFIEATNDRQFKVVFNVLVDFGGYNSYADIAIYNLARSTEGEVFKKYEYAAIRAGYEDNIDFIFKGQIVNIIREKAGPNTITRLICRGGAQSQDTSTINKSFESGVTVPTLCRECATAMGFPIVIKDDDFADVQPYMSGYLLSGDPKKKLNELSRSHGFSWLIENEKLIVVGNNSFREGGATVISASTGMEGVPEITEVGVTVSTRLRPEIKIGGRFQVESEFGQVNFSNVYYQDIPETAGQGDYRVQKLQYDGDSYGDKWTTRITGIR